MAVYIFLRLSGLPWGKLSPCPVWFLANGLLHTSPGQRPGFISPKTILSAESARHRAAVGPSRSIPPLAVIRLRPRRTPLIPYVPLIELQVILLEEVAVLLLEGPCPMMFFLMVNIAHEVF